MPVRHMIDSDAGKVQLHLFPSLRRLLPSRLITCSFSGSNSWAARL
jgi:hypothetical protein